MQDLSKKVLLLNIMLTQAILLVIAIAIKFFWAQHLSLNLLLEIRITPALLRFYYSEFCSCSFCSFIL